MDATVQTLSQGASAHSLSLDLSIKPSKVYIWGLRLLCGVGVGVTGYLAYTALLSDGIAACGEGQIWDCGHVLTSRWSKMGSVPVSVPAFAVYAIMLGALALCRPSTPKAIRKASWSIVTITAFSAGLAAFWFIGLQAFVVKHLCVYCMAAHSCGILLSAAILWRKPLGLRATSALASISVVGVGLMIGGQLMLAPPPTFKIERHAEESVADEFAAPIPVAGTATPEVVEEVEIFEPF